MIRSSSKGNESHGNMRWTNSYDVLQALKEKEGSWPYSAFFDEARISDLLECYDSFEKQSQKPISAGDDYVGASGDHIDADVYDCGEEHQYEVRGLIVNFLFEVVDYYKEEREVVAVAMNYLDRFLLTRMYHDDENILIPPSVFRDESDACADYKSARAEKMLDIYALVCLGIAIKLFSPTSGCPVRGTIKQHESKHRRKHLHQKDNNSHPTASKAVLGSAAVYDRYKFASITQIAAGLASAADLANAEKVIISTLDYFLNPVTSHAIIGEFFKVVTIASDIKLSKMLYNIAEFAQFQVELGLMDAKILSYAPSIQAAAAISNSVQRYLYEVMSPINGADEQSLHRRQEDINEMKNLLHIMEIALKVSIQLDQRIVKLREIFSDLLKSNDRFKSRTKKSTSSKSKAPSSHLQGEKECKQLIRKASEYPKKSEYDEQTFWDDPYCFFTVDFDELFPSVKQNRKPRDPGRKIDLADHYNKFIRPKLYGQDKHLDDNGYLTATCSLTDDSNSHNPMKIPGCNDIVPSAYLISPQRK